MTAEDGYWARMKRWLYLIAVTGFQTSQSFLAANDGNWTQVSLSKREFIGSLIRKRYWGKAEWNELLQGPGPHKLEPEYDANGPWPCFSPLVFFSWFISFCRQAFPVCWETWLLTFSSRFISSSRQRASHHHQSQPPNQIHITTREDIWLVLIGHMFSSGPASES